MRLFLRSPRRALATLAAVSLLARAPLVAQSVPQSPQPLRDTTHRTSVAADYEYDSFSDDVGPWRFGSVSLGHRADLGSVIGRYNWASRLGQTGSQVEADAYPKLGGNGVYAYLNLGYSSTALYPRWRSGAELYTNLPHAYEASLGYRQLRFAGSTPVTLLTGTVGKYTGNYWLSLRPYFRTRSNGASMSATFTGRQYFADANNYAGLRIGYGITPNDELTAIELARTNSFTADVHVSRTLAERLFGTATIGYENEQLVTRTRRNRLNLTAGLRYDF